MNNSYLAGKKIAFIGGGNMAGALIAGLLTDANGNKKAVDFLVGVLDTDRQKQADLAKLGAVALQNGDELAAYDVIVLAVKPQVMRSVCADLKAYLADKLLISIAAGVALDDLQKMTGNPNIVRTMPNLTAKVGLGAVGLFASNSVNAADKNVAFAVMTASGTGVWVQKEADLHAVTAVAGSAPAYFFYFLEYMIQKGVAMGLDDDTAKQLAAATMQGAAVMAQAADPSQLRAQVTSKGGTTHAAITHLQAEQVGEELAAAMQACFDRSVQLANESE